MDGLRYKMRRMGSEKPIVELWTGKEWVESHSFVESSTPPENRVELLVPSPEEKVK